LNSNGKPHRFGPCCGGAPCHGGGKGRYKPKDLELRRKSLRSLRFIITAPFESGSYRDHSLLG
jgi:hypothetical protein